MALKWSSEASSPTCRARITGRGCGVDSRPEVLSQNPCLRLALGWRGTLLGL